MEFMQESIGFENIILLLRNLFSLHQSNGNRNIWNGDEKRKSNFKIPNH